MDIEDRMNNEIEGNIEKNIIYLPKMYLPKFSMHKKSI